MQLNFKDINHAIFIFEKEIMLMDIIHTNWVDKTREFIDFFSLLDIHNTVFPEMYTLTNSIEGTENSLNILQLKNDDKEVNEFIDKCRNCLNHIRDIINICPSFDKYDQYIKLMNGISYIINHCYYNDFDIYVKKTIMISYMLLFKLYIFLKNSDEIELKRKKK